MEEIVLATADEVKLVGKLYDLVNDYFAGHTNYCYPNWQKGKYPVLTNAEKAFAEQSLYVMKVNGVIAGSVILNHWQHPEYKKIPWTLPASDNEVMTMNTLAVDPAFRKQGVGEALVRFSIEFCRNAGAKTVRTDTHFANLPARRLYLRCGFQSLGCQKACSDGIIQEFDVFEYIF